MTERSEQEREEKGRREEMNWECCRVSESIMKEPCINVSSDILAILHVYQIRLYEAMGI